MIVVRFVWSHFFPTYWVLLQDFKSLWPDHSSVAPSLCPQSNNVLRLSLLFLTSCPSHVLFLLIILFVCSDGHTVAVEDFVSWNEVFTPALRPQWSCSKAGAVDNSFSFINDESDSTHQGNRILDSSSFIVSPHKRLSIYSCRRFTGWTSSIPCTVPLSKTISKK